MPPRTRAQQASTFASPPAEVDQVFAPFVRLPELRSLAQRLRTLLLAATLLPLRLGLAVFALVACVVWCKLTRLETFCTEAAGRGQAGLGERIARAGVLLLFRLLLLSFGVLRVQHTRIGPFPCDSDEEVVAPVVVSNHLSYLDIAVLMSELPGGGCFVAKAAVGEWFGVGTVARAMGCLFVQTASGNTERLVQRVRQAERQASPEVRPRLVVFPEGTTTNGSGMVRFRAGAFAAGSPCQPVLIRFSHGEGAFNPSWETIPFPEHLFRLLTQPVNRVELLHLPVYTPNPSERRDAVLYARNVQTVMASALGQPVFDLNRQHKMLYHRFLLGKTTAEEALSGAKELALADYALS